MSRLIGNAIVGQSGGPTAAINATLAGVISGVLECNEINTLYGMRNGVEGLLREDIVDLSALFASDAQGLELLKVTPAAALGSCRRKLGAFEKEKDVYLKLFEIFRKYNIRYFFYIGGNDSMDTVLKLSEYSALFDYEIRVVGVPKTIDNDLLATDHTPGFGSAAKYVATAIKEIKRDVSVYTVKAVTIVEIMGRDAGWLTASAALPSVTGDGPDLVYLPERPFDDEAFIDAVKAALDSHSAVLVAVSEGVRYPDGRYVGEGTQSGAIDAFGHKYLAGTGKVLEHLVKDRIGCKVRSVELSLTQRCAAHMLSRADIEESVTIGRAAVESAVGGASGVMMTFERSASDTYGITVRTESIKDIANGIRRVPDSYINEAGNGITQEGIEYLLPLINGEMDQPFEFGMPKHYII